jgi:CheY-like chemotaxis protein
VRFGTETVTAARTIRLPNRPVIAVVDDDAAMREALSELLQVFGLPCRNRADAFLAAYAPGPFNCVTTDIRMPGISGLELLQKLNSLGSTIPVIVVTIARTEAHTFDFRFPFILMRFDEYSADVRAH